MWKINELPKSVISNRRPQFAAKLMKELNKMLKVETKLLTLFYP